MPDELRIEIDWEELNAGSPEERACFGAVGIYANGQCLTEGSDALLNRLRQRPLLSAYHLAEWVAWNWWRLRWEPANSGEDWPFAHRLTTIGGGYIWPSLIVQSDGARLTLIARPTRNRRETPFRYIADQVVSIPAMAFESEIDRFIDQVIDRLEWAGIEGSNLQQLWSDVLAERRSPDEAQSRKFEALLGCDPDEAEVATVRRLVEDADEFGVPAVEELAADHDSHGRVLTGLDLHELAASLGRPVSLQDMVHLRGRVEPRGFGEMPAWRAGTWLAQELRAQEGLGAGAVSDAQLAAMAGAVEAVVEPPDSAAPISFVLGRPDDTARIVLRSKWREGRRFELARLLGDRNIVLGHRALSLATRAGTYRQKAQRAFAAEFLSPFEEVEARLGGDYSAESQMDVADAFRVSPLQIRTMLVNHGRLSRRELDDEATVSAT